MSAPSTPVTIDVNVDAVVDGSEVTQTAAASGDEDTTIDLNLAIALGGDSTTGAGDLDQPQRRVVDAKPRGPHGRSGRSDGHRFVESAASTGVKG